MIKNRTFQLMFQTAFCTLGLIGILSSFGLFDYSYKENFYIYFTNLSNYLCFGIMIVELIQTIKKSENNYVDKLPILKFASVIAILITFIVFNFILAKDREIYLNFQINSVLFHIILPIMYVLDWFLFYEKGKVKLIYPICSAIFPFTYIIFIFIRAWILEFNPAISHIYPYFFLNLNKLGVFGVIKWIINLTLGFIIFAFLLYGIDKIMSNYKKHKK